MCGYQQFYWYCSYFGSCIFGFLFVGLLCLVCEEWCSIVVVSLLFYGSVLFMGLLVYYFFDLIYSVVSLDKVSEMEFMYVLEIICLGLLGVCDISDDWEMFGFYIMNNIGIVFQIFVSGVLLGFGSLFFLLFNGLMIGLVVGYLMQIGYVQIFWLFVIGYGVFELIVIIFVGVVGFKFGWVLFVLGCLICGEVLWLVVWCSV